MQNQQKKCSVFRDENYVPIVEQACNKVTGFRELYKELERSITINGKSKSALENYSRQLAHLALHYNRMPLELDAEEVMDYLYQVKRNGEASDSFFKFTVHGMRYACKMRGLDYAQFELPSLKGPKKLPVVLNGSEIKALISSCKLLRHRLIIGLCYGCGLRSSEVQHLEPSHIDLERKMLHVHQGKGLKDRCVPLGELLPRGITSYLDNHVPVKYMFESKTGEPMTGNGIRWVVKNAARQAGIIKDIYPHTLRHSFATHLLENDVNIVHIKDLLGHKRIETTLIYLQVARPQSGKILNPLDILYGLE
ncbi:tyrosine-type recombinase/integrase [Dysgonomonas termitidis]|uniref:Tyrosine-type recombinase/integrase n=1 Tax=Dysgonomonas termitidis TaxID=1516126 RepID=A0ABV9L0A0_9BACT